MPHATNVVIRIMRDGEMGVYNLQRVVATTLDLSILLVIVILIY
jgi:hypothetical protein